MGKDFFNGSEYKCNKRSKLEEIIWAQILEQFQGRVRGDGKENRVRVGWDSCESTIVNKNG